MEFRKERTRENVLTLLDRCGEDESLVSAKFNLMRALDLMLEEVETQLREKREEQEE